MPKRKKSAEEQPKTLPAAVSALVDWLVANGADLDGLDIRPNADSSYGLYATKAIPAGGAIGNLPTKLILDPLAVLAEDPVALASLKLGGSPAFSFWLALAAARKDSKHYFAPYLAALPLEAPDPCAWPAVQRKWLDGTQLATRVEGQRRLLADEHRKIALKAAKHVSFEDLLWARGVHLSRCFPRALVDASKLSAPHEVLASSVIDEAASLTVEHGGTFSAPKVEWRTDGREEAEEAEEAAPGAASSSSSHGDSSGGGERKGKGKRSKRATSPAPPPPPAPAPPPTGAADGASEEEEEHAAGNLGCMLPLYDMFDHKVGHPIGWEAGCGGVRFRSRTQPCVLPGQPLYNNYGPKGNQELLFTYGFSVEANPLDAVEGIMVGCAPTEDEALAAERRRLLDEFEVSYSVRPADGALLIGPFEIFPPSAAKAAAATDAAAAALQCVSAGPAAAAAAAAVAAAEGGGGGQAGEEAQGEEEGGEEGGELAESYFPPELLLALQVVGMESVEEGPMLTVDELEVLRATLDVRLRALSPTEKADVRLRGQATREAFVGAYREGQRRVLRAALSEVRQMMSGAAPEAGAEGGDEEA
jgi:hypothetical protein